MVVMVAMGIMFLMSPKLTLFLAFMTLPFLLAIVLTFKRKKSAEKTEEAIKESLNEKEDQRSER